MKIKSINKVEISVTSVTETLKALILLAFCGDSSVLKLSRQLSLLSQKTLDFSVKRVIALCAIATDLRKKGVITDKLSQVKNSGFCVAPGKESESPGALYNTTGAGYHAQKPEFKRGINPEIKD